MEAPKETPTYVHPSGKVLPVDELAPVVNPLEDSKDESTPAPDAPEAEQVAPAPEKKKRAKK